MAMPARFPRDSIRSVGERHFVVTGYELADTLLRDARLRPGTTPLADLAGAYQGPVHHLFRDMILFQLPPRHRVVRPLVRAWFTPQAVSRLQRLIDVVCDRVIANARTTPGRIDFVDAVARIVPLDVISELIGIPEDGRGKVCRRTETVIQAMWPTVGDVRRADGAAQLLDRYFRQLVETRRQRLGADLVSALIADGSLTEDEIVANLVFLIIAATFTSGDFLSSAIVLAVRDPLFRTLLRSGDNVDACIEEALRLYPPIAHALRNTAEDVVLGSVTMPANSLVDFDIAAANRDPSQFPEPDEFRPSRSPRKSLSFGMGAHYCAGWALGRAEAETLLPRFLAAFPTIELDGDPVPKRHQFQQGYVRVPMKLASPVAAGHG